tara:strand:- start:3236 stop:3466 length:231 start_codon:yes stop_codon:yes gene_type:complete
MNKVEEKMKIKINGEEEVVEKESVTISDLLVLKNVKMPEMVSVEHNGEMLERDNFSNTAVSEGDEVEFLYFMGGGQ